MGGGSPWPLDPSPPDINRYVYVFVYVPFEDTPAPESKQIPERLCCPISLELMVRPVIAADGHTYDRSSIEDWLARGNTTSPTTGAPLEHLHLADNHLVRSMVSEYQDSLASR